MKRILGAVLFATLGGCDDPKDKCLDETGAKISAFVISQRFVKDALVAPSTARFPSYADNGVSVVFKRECHFGVIGYVDSQNGFGATIRSNYFIEIEANPVDGSYSGTNLLIH